jgi:hypothetical protein
VKRTIAYCPCCGNVSVDGINFKRVEDAAIPTLQCAACGATSSDFEYVPRVECDQLLEGIEAYRLAWEVPKEPLGKTRDALFALADRIKSKGSASLSSEASSEGGEG